jgi:hypothetical protein
MKIKDHLCVSSQALCLYRPALSLSKWPAMSLSKRPALWPHLMNSRQAPSTRPGRAVAVVAPGDRIPHSGMREPGDAFQKCNSRPEGGAGKDVSQWTFPAPPSGRGDIICPLSPGSLASLGHPGLMLHGPCRAQSLPAMSWSNGPALSWSNGTKQRALIHFQKIPR